ncbi:translation elongation factor Ts [Ascidiaceihabitans sp.]|uniref:translation elongation factor Ts n=1 Tax=Ascidiaceihabitans sp. TaxID=1872644 RepID=UPI00329836ED
MAITAAMVKELRDSTGAGMMDAKKALTENDGDMEAAVDWLRTKGLAKAAKKSGRTAAEGLVAVKVEGGKGVAVEVNSETDFVGKNADFQKMVAGIADVAINTSDIDALKAADMDGKSVEQTVTDAVAVIGENMSVRRMAVQEGSTVVSYVHNAAAPGMGKIGVLVAMDGGDEAFGKQVAMHIAATNPLGMTEEDVSSDIVAREKAVFVGQATEEGKSEAGIESWSNKQVAKFIKENTLANQKFVINPKQTVFGAAKEVGATITGYVRLEVGEGIEVVKEDFAAEVAKAAQG